MTGQSGYPSWWALAEAHDVRFIEVRCDDASHAPKTAMIGRFFRRAVETDGEPDWQVDEEGRIDDGRGEPEMVWALEAIVARGWWHATGPNAAPGVREPSETAWARAVARHRAGGLEKVVLQCDLCGLNFQRRWARLDHSLDVMAAIGVKRVRLPVLVRSIETLENLELADLVGVSSEELARLARMFE